MSPKPTEVCFETSDFHQVLMFLLWLLLLNIHILPPKFRVIVLIVIQELQTRQKLSIIGRKTSSGLSDVAITSNGDSRFLQWLIHGCKTYIASV